MKNYLFFSLFLIALVSFSCSASVDNTTQKTPDGKISIADFKTKLSSVSNPQLIDVRTPEEFGRGSLTNAVNMDFRSETFDSQLNTLDKSKPVFIFCQSGGRSGKSYTKMKAMGFSEVFDMEGGYGSWSKQ